MTVTKKPTVKDLMEKLKAIEEQVQEIDLLKKRIVDLETELNSLKNTGEIKTTSKVTRIQCKKCPECFNSKADMKKHDKRNHGALSLKCDSCYLVFSRNCDLELHLETEHKTEKQFKCEKCEMTFVLNWRLKKHLGIHEKKKISNRKFCHYFNNDKECPFTTLGCMFRHEKAPKCKFIGKCSKPLCSFKHNEKKDQSTCQNSDFVNKKGEVQDDHIGNDHSQTLAENEEGFHLYVQHNFEKVFDNFEKENQHIKCYYCSYISKNKVLYHIQSEIHEHLKQTHPKVVDNYLNDPDVFIFENEDHEDFIYLFTDP